MIEVRTGVTISRCRNCGGEHLDKVLDLGFQPPSNSFVRPSPDAIAENRYPLEVVFCVDCTLAQLTYAVDPAELFKDYVYVSSTSRTLRTHLSELARTLYELKKPGRDDLVMDIGSNDGALLKGYADFPVRRLGVEPSTVADIARASGIPTHQAFFSRETASEIVATHGQAAIVTATNVFAHAADQDDFLAGLQLLLKDDGIFVVEVPYVVDTLQQNLFDTIYHEHIFYFSVHAIEDLLGRRGFRVFNIDRLRFGPSGPPIRVFACKKGAGFSTADAVMQLKELERGMGLTHAAPYSEFASRVWTIKRELVQLLDDLRSQGERIIGFGAPAKGNTILNTFQIGPDRIDCILERNNLKIGLLTPGTHIPVVDEEQFDSSSYKYALLLSWNLIEEFLANSGFVKQGGRFIVPLPRPAIVPHSS